MKKQRSGMYNDSFVISGYSHSGSRESSTDGGLLRYFFVCRRSIIIQELPSSRPQNQVHAGIRIDNITHLPRLQRKRCVLSHNAISTITFFTPPKETHLERLLHLLSRKPTQITTLLSTRTITLPRCEFRKRPRQVLSREREEVGLQCAEVFDGVGFRGGDVWL